MLVKKSFMAATAALAVAAALGTPLGAFAEAAPITGEPTNEVQSVTSADDTLKEKATAHVATLIDTTGGTWSDGTNSHPNGTYVVTVPTRVGYKNVNVGKVDLTATYPVTVKGVIGTGDNITCTVSYNRVMNGALRGADGGLLGGVGPYDSVDGGKLNAELTQGKTVWSGEEVSKLADDGNTVVGTSGTDSLHFTGSVRSATQFADSLNYSFSTGYANIGAALNKVHSTPSDNH